MCIRDSFSLDITVEALWADIGRNCAVLKGVGHFERKFQGERGDPTNDFWHQKSRVSELSYGEKKLPKSSTAWVGCTNVTDRQTDRQQTDNRQTTDGRLIAYSDREREFTFAKNESINWVKGLQATLHNTDDFGDVLPINHLA